MKSNPSPSAPLNLCPPTGVTGTTLPAAKVIARYDTSRGNVALEITRYTSHDGKVSYSYTGKHGAGSGHALEHVKNTVRIMLASHKGIRLSSGWDVLNEPSPAFPVKDTPNESAEDAAWQYGGYSSLDVGDVSPASPVDSVGVPAPDSAPLMDGRENLQGVTFVSKNHAGKTPWTVEHYHRNGEWVCRESQYGTTMNFHEREIKAWRKAPPVDGFKLQSMRLREERSRIIVMEDGSMLVANTEDEAEAIVEACASHAAKDAKIKALEDKFREIETICTESPADCRKRMGTRVGNVLVIARAALALPCA